MKKAVSTAILGAALLAQTGCMSLTDNPVYGPNGLIWDRSNAYLESTEGKTLSHDEGDATLIASHNLLDVPNFEPGDEVKFEDGIPRPNYFYPVSRTERVGLAYQNGELAILVAATPDEVWRDLASFFEINKITVDTERKSEGFIETGWIDPAVTKPGLTGAVVSRIFVFDLNEDESDVQDRLRLYITPVAGGTQISVDHLRHSPAAAPRWPEEPAPTSTYQSDMTFTMARYLAELQLSTEAKSLSALSRGSAVSAFGRDGSGNPVLRNRANYDQTWSSLLAAVNAVEAQVLFEDAHLGKLCFKRDDYVEEAQASLGQTLLSLLQDGTEVLDDPLDRITRDEGASLCLTTRTARAGTLIGVISSGGNNVPSQIADQVLWELKPHL